MQQNLTKIICTIGPASNSYATIVQLIQEGMRIARLNASHGTQETHTKSLTHIRKASERLKIPVAVLLDLQGPKIRLGDIADGPVRLVKGNTFRLVSRKIAGNAEQAYSPFKRLIKEVKTGHRVLIDDGLVKLRVRKKDANALTCDVVTGGMIDTNKGINLPDTDIKVPALTAKDRRDLLFGIRSGIDYVALSFVRRAQDIFSVKRFLKKHHADIPVIAKLEKPEAISHLEEIIEATDCVMIARGDLGVEMPLEQLPPLQKRIIALCRNYNKPVITATQMLESMRTHPSPTRAEVSDVANAIFDMTDAVMLSAETATGQYPVKTVRIMSKIIREAESATPPFFERREVSDTAISIPDAISRLAQLASREVASKAIVVFTQSGYSAQIISSYRPAIPIYAFTPEKAVQHRLALLRGVTCFLMEIEERMVPLTQQAEKILLKHRLVKKNDMVTILAGTPIQRRGITNLLKLHRIGEPLQ